MAWDEWDKSQHAGAQGVKSDESRASKRDSRAPSGAKGTA